MQIANCPLCEAQIQRTIDGTLQDGVALHFQICHPGKKVPTVEAS